MEYLQGSKLYEIYDQAVTEQAKQKKDIWSVDACATWMVEHFRRAFPERWVEVGIAEQNMVGVAAGIASTGKMVFANTMATFLTLRAIEQVKIDILYNHLNVKLVSSHSGVIGGPWGSTHHALEDIAYCRTLPFMKVIVPADAYEVREAVGVAVSDVSPIYIRLERDEPVERNEDTFRLGKAIELYKGKDVTLIATGSMVSFSQRAAKILAKRGISASVIDMHTIKPIDQEAILKAGKDTGNIVTVEEHEINGGLGSAVAEVVAESGLGRIRLKRIGMVDTLVEIVGSYKDILKHYELMPEDIAKKTEDFVKSARR
jgi:transketolase